MKKILLILSLFISSFASAQVWNNTGAVQLQRSITGSDTSYRNNMGALGFAYWMTKPQIIAYINSHPPDLSGYVPYTGATTDFTTKHKVSFESTVTGLTTHSFVDPGDGGFLWLIDQITGDVTEFQGNRIYDFNNGSRIPYLKQGEAIPYTDTLTKIVTKSQLKLNGTLPIGNLGQIQKVSTDLTNKYDAYDPILLGNYVSTQAQLDSAKTTFVSQAQIFATWLRFASGGSSANPTAPNIINDSIPSVPIQTNTWSYNSGTNVISSTFNSGSYIGFVSPGYYKKYNLTATLSSSAADNDNIGLVIGFVEDKSDMVFNHAYHLDPSDFNWPINTTDILVPNQHLIAVFRNRSDLSLQYYVVYDPGKTGQRIIANGTSLLTYKTLNNWPSVSVDLNVQRLGDTIRIKTTEFSDASGGKGSLGHQIQFTLNDLSVLNKFKAGSAYGYACESQAQSNFTNVSFSGNSNSIFDLRNGDVWVADNSGVYSIDTLKNVFTETPEKSIVFNPVTNYEYYVQNGEYTTIVTPAHDSLGGSSLIPTNGLQKIVGTKDSVGIGSPLTQPLTVVGIGGERALLLGDVSSGSGIAIVAPSDTVNGYMNQTIKGNTYGSNLFLSGKKGIELSQVKTTDGTIRRGFVIGNGGALKGDAFFGFINSRDHLSPELDTSIYESTFATHPRAIPDVNYVNSTAKAIVDSVVAGNRFELLGVTSLFTQSIPAGYFITDIIVRQASGSPTVNIGTTNGGGEIQPDEPVTDAVSISANQLFSTTANIYVKVTGSGSVNAYIYYYKNIN